MSAASDLRLDPAPSAPTKATIRTGAAFWRGGPKLSRNRIKLIGAGLLAALVAAVAASWLAERWSHVVIDDARIAASLVTLSSEVSGRVTEVSVAQGDAVSRGDRLVSIDRAQADLELAALDARIAGTKAQQDQLRAQQRMVHGQVASRLAAGEAEVSAAEAAHRLAETRLQAARGEAGAVAEQAERVSAASVETAKAALAVIRADEAQGSVLDLQIATLEAQRQAQIAERDRKRIDIERGSVSAGFDGVVDKTFVDPGEYVAPGARLLIYHDPSAVWVEANVKETAFRKLAVGAQAAITVDAYPGESFEGRVISLGDAATSEFALLPSPNPSGNFTKVTQRLPVRVSIEQHDGRLRPGMMVEVSVDVVD